MLTDANKREPILKSSPITSSCKIKNIFYVTDELNCFEFIYIFSLRQMAVVHIPRVTQQALVGHCFRSCPQFLVYSGMPKLGHLKSGNMLKIWMLLFSQDSEIQTSWAFYIMNNFFVRYTIGYLILSESWRQVSCLISGLVRISDSH